MGSGNRQDDLLYDLDHNDSLGISSLDAFINSFISKACTTSIIVFATPVFLILLSETGSNRHLRPKNKELSHQIVA